MMNFQKFFFGLLSHVLHFVLFCFVLFFPLDFFRETFSHAQRKVRSRGREVYLRNNKKKNNNCARIRLKFEDDTLLTFLLTVRQGDTKKVTTLLSQNPSLPNELDLDGKKTALDYAVEEKQAAVVSVLIPYKPKDEDSRLRALIWAAEQGYGQLVAKILVEWPESIGWQTVHGEYIMEIAASSGNVEIVARLLAIDPTFVARPASWRYAAINGQDEVLKLLLSRKCPMVVEAERDSALHLAVENRRESTVALLLAERPQLIHVLDDDVTILHVAAGRGNANIVAQLLAVKPEMIDMITKSGSTVLHAAAGMDGSPEVIDLLLDRRPGLIDVLDQSGMTALHVAASCKERESFLKLLARCPHSMDIVARGGQNTLHFVAFGSDIALLAVTLALRPEFASGMDNFKGTPLHYLSSSGRNCDPENQPLLEQYLERIYQLSPSALRAVNAWSSTPYMASIGENDWGTKCFFPKLSWDEIIEGHENTEEDAIPYLAKRVDRLQVLARDLMITPVLESLLHPHVLGIVCEYFFLGYVKPTTSLSNYVVTEPWY